MGDGIQIRVDESMIKVLEVVRKDAAERIKKLFMLDEVSVYGTLSSQILAAHYLKKKQLHFRVRKVGRGRGVLEILE